MGIKFLPVSSGSDGNSIFISTDTTKILVDVGISGVRAEKYLVDEKLTCQNLDAIFVTHEHSDHISGVGVISRRFDVPIFASSGTWDYMEKFKLIGKISPKNKRYVYSEENIYINDVAITPFSIPHDAAEPLAYTINAEETKISIATDIGHITETIVENLKNSHLIYIESNHDVEMLNNGSYPYPLKKRILGDFGHMSNVTTAKLLTHCISNKLKHIILGHLSDENNTSLLAYETVKSILESNNFCVNKDFDLHIIAKGQRGKLIEL